MRRTKPSKQARLPDAINACPEQEPYTRIRNSTLRAEGISFKATGILAVLLSNSDGWYSFSARLERMKKDGKDAVRSGIVELEEAGYLMRVRFRDKSTKRWIGSFWAYTDSPGKFDISLHEAKLESRGWEIGKITTDTDPESGFPHVENPTLRITIDKNNKEVDTTRAPSSTNTKQKSSWPRKNIHLALSRQLIDILHRKAKINKTALTASWAQQVRALCRELDDRKAEARVRAALKYLDANWEDTYTPKITSGYQLRDKFIQLEQAASRSNGRDKSARSRIIGHGRHRRRDKTGEPHDEGKWFPVMDINTDGEQITLENMDTEKETTVWAGPDGRHVLCPTYPEPYPGQMHNDAEDVDPKLFGVEG